MKELIEISFKNKDNCSKSQNYNIKNENFVSKLKYTLNAALTNQEKNR